MDIALADERDTQMTPGRPCAPDRDRGVPPLDPWPRTPWWRAAALLVGLWSCHDASRDNPLDPALTPSVELTAVLDDTAGTVALVWGRYEGDQPFSEYRVLRHVARSTEVDTLSRLSAVADTTYVDTALAPNTAYVYRVAVVNARGFSAPSGEQEIAGYAAGPVVLLAWDVDAEHGHVEVRWSRYRGGRFAGYRVERRLAEAAEFSAVARLGGAADTTYRDAGLAPDTPCFYRVVVAVAGTQWTSNVSGLVRYGLEGVELLPVHMDSLGGTAQLRWRPYRGPGFAGYRVTRRRLGADRGEVLGELPAQTDTAWVDRTVEAGTDYLYAVAVRASGQELASNAVEGRLELATVRLVRADFSSPTATATLAWTRYAGPRFQAYRVGRRTEGQVPQVVAEIADPAVTALVDSHLVGNTEHFYHVQVITQRAEVVTSPELSGAIHRLVAQFPLPVAASGSVRLYAEPGGRVAALAAQEDQVRLYLFDPAGRLLVDRVLYQDPSEQIAPASVSMVALADGRRLVSVASQALEAPVNLLSFSAEGQPVVNQRPLALFAEEFAAPLDPVEATVAGEVHLITGLGRTQFDNALVSSRGSVLCVEDFEEGRPEDWDFPPSGTSEREYYPSGGIRGVGAIRGTVDVAYSDGAVEYGLAPVLSAPAGLLGTLGSMKDSTWTDFRFEADLRFASLDMPHAAGLRIGGPAFAYSTFLMLLDQAQQQATLTWLFSPPLGSSGLERQSAEFAHPFPVFAGLTYRPGLEVVDGRFSASVQSAVLWQGAKDPRSHLVSLALVQDRVALITGLQPYTLDADGEGAPYGELLTESASEIRVWQDSRGRGWMGVCQPQGNRIAVSRSVIQGAQVHFHPLVTGQSLGATAGRAPGQLLLPLSFDVGPDGRFFVLDAGNARVQVFDAERLHVTQWGHQGSAAGEFDFGSVGEREPFAGSLCVDDEGYIYVADVANQRVQKFAP